MLLFPPVGVQRDKAADREERAAFDPCAWFIHPTEHKHVGKWAGPGDCDGGGQQLPPLARHELLV